MRVLAARTRRAKLMGRLVVRTRGPGGRLARPTVPPAPKGGRADSCADQVRGARVRIRVPKGLKALSFTTDGEAIDGNSAGEFVGNSGAPVGVSDPDGSEDRAAEPMCLVGRSVGRGSEMEDAMLAGMRVPDAAVAKAKSTPEVLRVSSPGWCVDHPRILAKIWCAVRQEAGMTWDLLKSDLCAATYPGWLFTAMASRKVGAVEARIVAGSMVYFVLYLYQFCVANQLGAGVEEDRLNKDWRPIPSGQMSVVGGWVRYAVGLVAFAAVGQALGVLPYALLWEVAGLLHNSLRLSRHYAAKSACMVAGIVGQMGAGWGMVTTITPEVWRWIAATSAASFVWGNIQDLRDLQGDQAALGTVLCWLVAARLLLYQSPRGLHRSYNLYIDFYGLLHLGAFFLPTAGGPA
eukprot:evm.model.scf_3002.1 EVM.evm.TU.scf_3002.1   scf_3002:4278-5636(-)